MYSTIMKNNKAICCPACQGTMIPVTLRCDACDINVSGRFGGNEFAGLGEEDLHFLRIFVLCEGRIREMESALGVSYPTIKARLAQLKETLAAGSAGEAKPLVAETSRTLTPSEAVLQELEAGRLTFDQAMQKLKLIQRERTI
jgi:hypothetical protein